MSIKIVTDSTADLPAKIIKKLNIHVIPVYINIGNKSFLDGVEITRSEFYQNLPGYSSQPTTSASGTGAFVQLYRKLLEKGADGILSFHISKNLSNVANVAQLAAQEFDVGKVRVVDPGQLTLGTGLLAHAAAQMAAAGARMKEIEQEVMKEPARTYTFAILDTLEFLRRSGRVSGLAAGLGSLLDIKPMLKMHFGEMALEKIRTRNGALKRLVTLAEGLGSLEQLALVHTHAVEKAHELKKMIAHLIPAKSPVWIEEVTPVIGAHVGPGAVWIVCMAS